jgi:hypothetical protein
MFGTYNSLRFGMAFLALSYPILLFVIGKLNGISLAGSISEYYWASTSVGSPVRIAMSVGLSAIGVFLYLYKGFTLRENYALNAAAVFAIGVVAFPMEWNCNSPTRRPPIDVTYCFEPFYNPHGLCAVALFLCLTYVVFSQARATLPAIKDAARRAWFRRLYWLAGIVMVATPCIAALLHLVSGRYDKVTFFLEAGGIYGFVFFWVVKSIEMRSSQVEQSALEGNGLPPEA